MQRELAASQVMMRPAHTAMDTLEYTPIAEVREQRSRRRTRALLLALTCVPIVAAAGAFLWFRGPNLYRQRQCLSYQDAPDRVVYASGPGDQCEALLSADPRYARVGRILSTTTHAGVLRTAPDWDDLIHEVEGPRAKGVRGPLFVHERRTPAGLRRLVAMELNDDGLEGPLRSWVIEPTRLDWPPVVLWRNARSLGGLEWGGLLPGGLQICAGVPDPADASRWTLPFILDGRRGTVDCRLADDDHVVFEIRDEKALWERGTRPKNPLVQ